MKDDWEQFPPIEGNPTDYSGIVFAVLGIVIVTALIVFL